MILTLALEMLFTILLKSRYVDLPRRPMFWENTADVENIAISSLISRNRFDEIMQNLNLADSSTLDPNDKFRKVSPLIKNLNEQCLLQYVGESMVPYFGRHGGKQFIRNKPVKFGHKFWVAATPSGYVTKLYPYMGKDENYDPTIGLGGSDISKLKVILPNQDVSNHHIVMDNFFTSLPLLRMLKRLQVAATRTARINHDEKALLK